MEDTKSHDVIPEDTDDLVLLFLFILNFVISYSMRLILWEFLTHIQGNIDNIFYICKMFCCLLGVLSLNMYIYNI